MEQFNVEVHRVVDNGDGTFYYELSPTNLEIKEYLLHGHDGVIDGTIESTIASEMSNHRIEMFGVLEQFFPDKSINYYL